ncbi:MAG: DNA polymerase III subunit epsilon [Rhodoferax sp.]|nr:DNA polymerase III subunit epsilon [Rhodoferax sp.]
MNRLKLDRRLVLAIVVIGVATLVWLLVTIGLIASTLAPAQLALVTEQLAPRLVLIGLTWLFGLVSIAATLRWLFRRYASAPARLLEQTQVLLAAPKAAPMDHHGTKETQALAQAIFQLASQRDGLYNSRARMQFKAISSAPALAGGAELMGIGRSIYAVFDRQLVAHALESIRQRMERGAASPSAQFVTTTQAGQLLKVQMAPVRHVQSQVDEADISGFVLMLDNVTRAFEEEHLRDQLLHGLTEGSRSSLANIQAAVDMLAYPDLEADMRERFLGVVREEVHSMSERITGMTQKATEGLKARWPLEEMLGSDVLLAAQRRIQARSQRSVTLENLDTSLWLKVDSFSLTQALDYLAMRLVDEFDIKFFRLRLQASGNRGQLDLIWTGQAMSTETVMSWEMDSMRFGVESTPLTVRDVVERHGGEMWFERERVRHEAFFRFLLPLASVQEQLDASQLAPSDARPEFYDFDLFKTSDQSSALDDRLLSDLTFTVFDTETTGLSPSEGDEIIQMGAARIVNSKLLNQESFEQLVNPGRLIPAATIPIHGITQDMVQGKPPITEVLPAFYAFAQDTVLVAHNAAFDMKFLQLQEKNTGLVFNHPVLDTLLLSAVVHPNQESHRLEAIAERFNITVLGRHTALGDALVTAQVWLRLIPLLQAMGINTLRQAREAAQKTYYARLKY